jgi:phosphoribosyl 1,2-cyclic phosphodiesterase
MHVTFHGVRGSTPCHCDETRRYGGNTSCVSLSAPGEDPMVFDLGTGLRYFGSSLQHDGSFRGTALLTHFHWDHTQGLPFFMPILAEGAHLDVYAPVQEDGRSVAEVFEEIIRPPMFPVPIGQLPGSFTFHDLAEAEFTIGGLRVMSRWIPHIGPTLGFRVEWNGRSVAYVSDHQQTVDGSFRLSDGARELMDGVDVLIHDAQYSQAEFSKKATWGHCTAEFALWVAKEVRARTLVLYHHDPLRNDDDLDAVTECTRRMGEPFGVEVLAASQGLTLPVG